MLSSVSQSQPFHELHSPPFCPSARKTFVPLLRFKDSFGKESCLKLFRAHISFLDITIRPVTWISFILIIWTKFLLGLLSRYCMLLFSARIYTSFWYAFLRQCSKCSIVRVALYSAVVEHSPTLIIQPHRYPMHVLYPWYQGYRICLRQSLLHGYDCDILRLTSAFPFADVKSSR